MRDIRAGRKLLALSSDDLTLLAERRSISVDNGKLVLTDASNSVIDSPTEKTHVEASAEPQPWRRKVPDLDPLESVAASELVSSSLLAALIPALVNRGVLTQQDATEIYENALMLLEMQQGADPAVQHVYETARELIEAHLRPE